MFTCSIIAFMAVVELVLNSVCAYTYIYICIYTYAYMDLPIFIRKQRKM